MNLKTAFFSAMLLVLTAGCAAPAPATPDPTLIAEQVNAARTEAAATVVAQLTLDAPPAPTATEIPPTKLPTTEPPTATVPPLPTLAPTSTALPTQVPTLAYPTWTPTPAEYQCQIVAQSPSLGKYVNTFADLDARWTVKNTGLETWEKSLVDYFYISGDGIHKFEDRYDLSKDVKPGDEIDIIVDIGVPGLEGKYSETWVIGIGGDSFCTLPFSITVVE